MFKKAISLLLSLMLVITSLSVTAVSVFAEDTVERTYVVSGEEGLCGVRWDYNLETAAANIMTLNGDGKYEKVFTDVPAGKYQFKVAGVNPAAAEGEEPLWYGNELDGNIAIEVTDICDVTITFDPTVAEAGKNVTYSGDFVKAVEGINVEYMNAVGNGDGNWLNGVNWDPAERENEMTKISDGVYQVRYNDIDEFDDYQLKFAANGTWSDNWGGTFEGNGVTSEAVYNSPDNIYVDTTGVEICDVVITLDITKFDYSTKKGATFKVEFMECGTNNVINTPVETTEEVVETTEEVVETTEEVVETTEEVVETTVADKPFLKVNTTSNYFPAKSETYNAETKQITVTYEFQASKDILETEWYMCYDPAVVKPAVDEEGYDVNYAGSICPTIGMAAQVQTQGNTEDSLDKDPTHMAIRYAVASSSTFDFSSKKTVFAKVVFDVVADQPTETTIDMFVRILTVSRVGRDHLAIPEEEVSLVDLGVVYDNEQTATVTCDKSVDLTPGTWTPAPETTVAPDTTEDTTQAVEDPFLTVNATSNYFPKAEAKYNKDTKQVTVTYYFQASKDVLDAEWYMYYDPTVLKPAVDEEGYEVNYADTICPAMAAAAQVNTDASGDTPERRSVKFLAFSTQLFKFSSGEQVFANMVFDVVNDAPTTTTVDLYVKVLRVSKLGRNHQSDPKEEVQLVFKEELNDEQTATVTTSRRTELTPDTWTPGPETTAPETTVPETTVPETTVSETTVPETTAPPVGDPVFVVAGTPVFCNNYTWIGDPTKAPENVMSKDGDVYKLVFPAAAAGDHSIKVVENPADGSPAIWHGDSTGNNINFNISAPCDVTVTYNPATQTIDVTGENVKIIKELKIDHITAVGGGDGNWLNGAVWDPADLSNEMTEISNKVYQIRYNDIEGFPNYQLKFAANLSWTDSWGGVFDGFDVENDAVYNGKDIIIDTTDYELCDLILTLDLSKFDYVTKEGAKFTIKAIEKEVEPGTTVPETTVPETTVPETTVPETTVPETTVPETTVPETTVPDTTAPVNKLTVNATSNIPAVATQTFDEATGLVTVTYYLQSDKGIVNTHWTLTYDNAVLKYSDENNTYNEELGFMPSITTGYLYNTSLENKIVGDASNLKLYDFSTMKPFVQVTFEAAGVGETEVKLTVDEIRVGELNPATGTVDENTEEALILGGVLSENALNVIKADAKIAAGTGVAPIPPETTVPETTVPETTVPETTVPETTVPETTVPETTVPETTVPETTVPETTVPETTVPETTVPETTVPETTVPETTVPETTVPETTVPETTVPETTEAPDTTAAPETTEAPATDAPATNATSATGVTTGGSSTNTETPNTGTNNGGAVQTGSASMAIIILLVLVSATGVMYFTRKKYNK